MKESNRLPRHGRPPCSSHHGERYTEQPEVGATIGRHAVDLASPDSTGATSTATETTKDAVTTMDAEATPSTTPEEWGKLTEEFTVTLHGKVIQALVYWRPYDERWTLFTTVDAETNQVINAEVSLT